jgi:hypothetical protein
MFQASNARNAMTNITTTGSPSTKEQVTNKTGEVASTAKDQAAGVVHDTKRQAQRLAGESRDQLKQQAQQQTQRLAQTMRDIGQQLQGMATGQAPPSGMVADVTQQAASSAHDMADKLDQRGLDGVIADLKQFARRRPGVFIAGALGAGVIAGRLVRSMDTHAVMQAAKPDNEPSTGSGNGQPSKVADAPPSTGNIGSPPVIPRPEVVGTEPVIPPTEV